MTHPDSQLPAASATPRRQGGNDRNDPIRTRTLTLPMALALALSIGALVLLALGSVIAINWWVNVQNLRELASDKAVLAAEIVDLSVREHLEPAEDQLDFVGRALENGRIGSDDEKALQSFLMGALAATPQIEALIFWNADGNETVVAQERESQVLSVKEKDARNNPIARGLLDWGRNSNDMTWGEVAYVPEVGRSFLNLSRPLHKGDEFLGVVTAVISIRELSAMTDEVSDMFHATVFILEGRDHVVAHPYLTSGHHEASTESPLAKIGHVGDLVLSELWSGKQLPAYQEAAQKGVEVREVTLGDEQYLLLAKKMDSFAPTSWFVGLWVPSEQADEAFRRTRHSAFMTIGFVVLSAVSALLVGRWLATPIRRIAESARHIGALEFDLAKTLPTSPIKELDEQAGAFNRMLVGLRWLETYVPRTLVNRLMRQSNALDFPSEERELTVLFTDICGFTTMSENMEAPEIASLLNHHFAMLGSCVEAEDGTIDKYIGDALMAFWGAPDEQTDGAERACRAALAMERAILADNKARRAQGETPVRVRIGIHTGPVVVGNVGAPGRMNYTIVGDTVNTAQRIEQLAGKTDDDGEEVRILASVDVIAKLPDWGIETEFAGEFHVKGRTQPVAVHRLMPTGTS